MLNAVDHEALIHRFYTAFAALDADGMKACYRLDARFEDPVFKLEGREQIGGMWRMLTTTIRTKSRDVWKLEHDHVEAAGSDGSAHWEASYRFSATGRLVHNVIDARFTFRDGLIATHRDTFDFWRWSRQALGPAGVFLGWAPLLRTRVRAQAAANLAAFISRSPASVSRAQRP